MQFALLAVLICPEVGANDYFCRTSEVYIDSSISLEYSAAWSVYIADMEKSIFELLK